MRIGLFGGTFDPPHIAHTRIAQEAVKTLSLDKVFFVVSKNPLKFQSAASDEDRLAMTRLAVQDVPKAEVLDIELKRKGVSYTIDTIETLKAAYPDDDFFLIIGEDNFRMFKKWKAWEKTLSITTLVVFTRHVLPSEDVATPIDADNVMFIREWLDISATEIRQGLHEKNLNPALLHPDVLAYIRERHLYA